MKVVNVQLEFNHFDKVAVILVELSDENNIFEKFIKN